MKYFLKYQLKVIGQPRFEHRTFWTLACSTISVKWIRCGKGIKSSSKLLFRECGSSMNMLYFLSSKVNQLRIVVKTQTEVMSVHSTSAWLIAHFVIRLDHQGKTQPSLLAVLIIGCCNFAKLLHFLLLHTELWSVSGRRWSLPTCRRWRCWRRSAKD